MYVNEHIIKPVYSTRIDCAYNIVVLKYKRNPVETRKDGLMETTLTSEVIKVTYKNKIYCHLYK